MFWMVHHMVGVTMVFQSMVRPPGVTYYNWATLDVLFYDRQQRVPITLLLHWPNKRYNYFLFGWPFYSTKDSHLCKYMISLVFSSGNQSFVNLDDNAWATNCTLVFNPMVGHFTTKRVQSTEVRDERCNPFINASWSQYLLSQWWANTIIFYGGKCTLSRNEPLNWLTQ